MKYMLMFPDSCVSCIQTKKAKGGLKDLFNMDLICAPWEEQTLPFFYSHLAMRNDYATFAYLCSPWKH